MFKFLTAVVVVGLALVAADVLLPEDACVLGGVAVAIGSLFALACGTAPKSVSTARRYW